MQCEPPELYCGKAYKRICKKHQSFQTSFTQSLRSAIRYIEDPENVNPIPQLVSLYKCDEYEFWKLRGVAIANSGLRPSQWPRLWFGVVSLPTPIAVPLELLMHQQGYDDNQAERCAHDRLKQYVADLRQMP